MCRWKGSGNTISRIQQINRTTLCIPHFTGQHKPLKRKSAFFKTPPGWLPQLTDPSTESPEAMDPSAIAEPNGPPILYDVKINWPARAISNYSCPTFFQTWSRCRYIALAILDIQHVEFTPVQKSQGCAPKASLRPLEEGGEEGEEDSSEDEGAVEKVQETLMMMYREITKHQVSPAPDQHHSKWCSSQQPWCLQTQKAMTEVDYYLFILILSNNNRTVGKNRKR